MSANGEPMIDTRVYRHVLGHYPTGVCVVTGRDSAGSSCGMVVGTFTAVSLDPPLIGFFPDKTSRTWQRIERTGAFCVNVLASEQQDLCQRFSAKGDDKFAGLVRRESRRGLPILDGVVAWIDCDVEAVHEAGDHYFVSGRVRDLEVEDKANGALVFYRGKLGALQPFDHSQTA